MKHGLIPIAIVALVLTACAETPTSAPQRAPAPSFTENTTYGEALTTGTTTVFPSTNATNAVAGWSHVEFIDIDVGSVTLKFVQPRAFYACFEQRVDDSAPDSPTNYNTGVTDGLWPFDCLSTVSTLTKTISARQYVDVRLAFGGESDERFAWTRFYAPTSEESKALCKDGAWETNGFANLGQCVRFAETGKM